MQNILNTTGNTSGVKETGDSFMTDKRCKRCRLIRPASDYSPDRRSRDGLSRTCDPCKRSCVACGDAPASEGRYCDTCYRNGHKECSNPECIWEGRPLPLDHFYRSPHTRDGFLGLCKDCHRDSTRFPPTKCRECNRRLYEGRDICKLCSGETVPPDHKECPACSRTLPRDEFYSAHRSRDGLSHKCRECTIIANRR